jgi:multiple sugar transport system substrate-binding protein
MHAHSQLDRRQVLKMGGGAAALIGLGLPRPARAATKTIEVWSHAAAADTSVIERAVSYAVDSFMQKHPDITVNVTSMPWQQLSPTLLRAAKSGRVPDVSMLYSPDMQVQIAAGTLAPLNPFLAHWSTEDQRDVVQLPQARQGDTVFGMPWQVRTSGLMYRADLLAQAGVQPPKTLQQGSDVAARIAKDDVVGIALGFNPEGASVAGAWFLTTQIGLGANPINADGTANFATPEAERIVQWVYDQVNTLQPPTLPLDVALIDQEKEHDLFAAHRAVFLPSSSDRQPRVLEKAGLAPADIAMTAYPTFDADKPAPAVVQSWNLVIPKGAPQPDLSWLFVEHWTSADVQLQGAKIAGLGPVRASALKDPFFDKPEAAVLRWSTEYSNKYPLNFQFPPKTDVLYDVWVRMFGQVLNKQQSVKDGLAWANAEYNRRIG